MKSCMTMTRSLMCATDLGTPDDSIKEAWHLVPALTGTCTHVQEFQAARENTVFLIDCQADMFKPCGFADKDVRRHL